MSESSDNDARPPAPAPKAALIKRRWAIVGRAGGGAALLAVAGAIALGDPSDRTDPGQDSAGGDAQISAEG
jgi:hypothetical protein